MLTIDRSIDRSIDAFTGFHQFYAAVIGRQVEPKKQLSSRPITAGGDRSIDRSIVNTFTPFVIRGQGRPRMSREVALAREHAFSGADRGYSGKLSPHFAIKPAREASPTVPRAPFASRASLWSILEPRASSHEHRIGQTFSLARRYRTMHRHAFVPVAHRVRNRARFVVGRRGWGALG